MIEAGTILQDRYRVEKQIGQGGMGTVFVAVDERFGSRVAIKETFFEDENLKKAFEREARLLNSLKHPALPKVNDFFTENDAQFIVMEYIEGEDLSEKMERSAESYPIEDVLNWADQLCDALEYLHSQNVPVIHRDIKPQNLKLTPDGQVILLDFGLAKGNPTDNSHQTAAKSIFGYSRNYASLEQIQGTGTDPQSDLYSLAATIYHLAVGIPPADALTRAMNVLNAQSDPLIPANLVNGDIPKGVAEVLQETMALNSSERPATASELRAMVIDCDKTIVVGKSGTTANAVLSTDLFNQRTKLKSVNTNVQDLENLNLETEVLPERETAGKSMATRIVDKNPTEQSSKNAETVGFLAASAGSGTKFFTVAATIILLAFGAVLALFLYNSQGLVSSSETSGSEANFVPEDNEIGNENVVTDANTAIGESEFPDSNEDVAIKEGDTTKELPIGQDAGRTDKPSDTSEKTNNKGKVATTVTDKSQTTAETNGRGRIVVIDGTEKMIVDGDRVETDTMIIEGDKIRMKKTGKEWNPEIELPPLNPEQLKRLTPRQRQKIRELNKIQRIKSKDKKPPPPPENRYEPPPSN